MIQLFLTRLSVPKLICAGAILSLPLLGPAGCSAVLKGSAVSQTAARPSVQWQPPQKMPLPVDTVSKAAKVPPEVLANLQSLTLEQIVDIALRNNPDTRTSWASAVAAAAKLNSEKGAWLPSFDVQANANKSQGSVAAGRFSFNQFTYGPSVSLNYILFDFGKRGADIDAARQAMYSRNFTHNSTLQNVVLLVETAYFKYLNAKALFQAEETSFKEARENLEAAEQRHKAGLATIADVLQAKTTVSQAQLGLQDVEGRIKTIRGALATAIGLDANVEYDVGFLPNELPVNLVSETVDNLIAQAESLRPDLAAAGASVREAEANVLSKNAERLPSIALSGLIGRDYFNSRDRYSNNKRAGVALSFPLFSGFSMENDVLEAQAEAEAARGRFKSLKNRVVLDVWTSYYTMKTASQRMETSKDLLASATESHQVALERYKAGVGSMLELLAAQSTLENARALEVMARTDWLLSIAQLAHDTGTLWTYEETAGGFKTGQPEKEEQK
ncbi:MAG: hypothetical protein A3F83_03420 [Candidatus Glassbacteria bacterium RIFCSPLOWO2_12_FULL_58_11]|uniref:Protein CyaE n=1 Tax=Candidatus Glassbacteria bacterium RIFCSPLOWO2_12_FULL_58_11 TaxID=1817867 RepID=A0A1F5YRS2_9BACT|nr:MAG: hypothetical protein A3F83_03420 [Candidatus Glassbacteria bacterium RIFCSPLOWO2_12_FULL_58_11]